MWMSDDGNLPVVAVAAAARARKLMILEKNMTMVGLVKSKGSRGCESAFSWFWKVNVKLDV